MRAFNRRLRVLKSEILQWLVTADTLNLKPRAYHITANVDFEFATSEAKLVGFQAWVEERIKAGYYTLRPDGSPWVGEYIESAYKKGMIRSYTETHSPALAASAPFYEGSKAQFLEDAFNLPESAGKAKLLATRTFEQLKGVTAQMSQEMGRVLADGIIRGDGPSTIAREMFRRVDGINRKRALVIARTEVIHAHAEGQLDGLQALGGERVTAEVEWSTAGDDRVCDQCASLEGTTYTLEEARGMIPVHPNCRCAWLPVI